MITSRLRLLLAVLLLTGLQAGAQVSTYLFVQDSTTYSPINGTVIGDSLTDDQYFVDTASPLGGPLTSGPGIPIGFTFGYAAGNCDVFGISANGWIGIGSGSVNLSNTAPYFPLSTTAGGNIIAGFARNLAAQDGSRLEYATLGTAPDRVLVVQWTNYRKRGNVGDAFNFQIRLYEGSNNIEFVYGPVSCNINSSFVQVGMIGGNSSDFNLRASLGGGGWTGTVSGVLNSATVTLNQSELPPDGLVFRFGAPPPCTAPPVAGNASASAVSVCPNNFVTVTLQNFSSGPGQSYQWESSTDNLNWSPIVGAISTAWNQTLLATTWFRCVLTCDGQSAASTAAMVWLNEPTLCYCTTNLGGNCDPGSYGFIDLVKITGTPLINDNSGCTGTIGLYYTDYPDTGNYTATLLAGSSYTLTVRSSFNANESVWIDWDRNGTFDVTEWYDLSRSATPNVADSVTITVPGWIIPGRTKMRVRNRLASAPNSAIDACTQMASGETEDYT
ncbi:MAG: GEVED domain-containing protein, partial [Bacteroidota bacterium]